MAGVYIHIPFCHKACHYCDFHFSTNLKQKDEMIDAIFVELNLRQSYLTGPIDTIYFGGGTPSLLSSQQIKSFINQINLLWTVSDDVEITLESNPENLTFEYLISLYKIGVNRLSIGIQTFSNTALSFMNRSHNSQQAKDCYIKARKVGFDNISLDLIFANHKNTFDDLQNDLAQFIAWKPEHISAYNLTIEDGTAFGNWTKKGSLPVVNEDRSQEEFKYISKTLQSYGYEHYEISNFALTHKRSKHNTAYWQQKSYLGVGPGAHSYNHKSRSFNVANNSQYIKSISLNTLPSTIENLSRADKINEYLLISLRMSDGLNVEVLKNTWNHAFSKSEDAMIESWKNQGLLTIKNNIITLTLSGQLVADELSSNLFVP